MSMINLVCNEYLIEIYQVPEHVNRKRFEHPSPPNTVCFEFLHGEVSLEPQPALHEARCHIDHSIFSPYDTRHRLFNVLTTVFDVPMRLSANIVYYIARVLQEAMDTATDPTVPVAIGVNLMHATFDDELFQQFIEQLTSGDKVNFVPASKSAIEKLEQFAYEGCSESCVVCLTELETGVQVIKTPCSHLYHCECIIQWLSTSHVCPICRFPLPTDSS